MKKLAVLVVHGMGDQKSSFAQGMIRELEGRLRRLKLDPDAIEWMPVWWAPILSKAQSRLWRRSQDGGNLHWKWLRRFVVHSLGDAVAYRPVDGSKLRRGDINAYEEIHARIEKLLTRIDRLEQREDEVYERGRATAHQKRYAQPKTTTVLDVEFELI